MKKCPFCAEEIQDEAIVCRFCRMDLYHPTTPSPNKPPQAVWTSSVTPGAVGFFIVFVFLGVFFYIYEWSPERTYSGQRIVLMPIAAPNPAGTVVAESPPVITKAKYDQIKIGMTYDEVVQIIGERGNEMMSDATSVICEWGNIESVYMNGTFNYGYLANKSQMGLQ